MADLDPCYTSLCVIKPNCPGCSALQPRSLPRGALRNSRVSLSVLGPLLVLRCAALCGRYDTIRTQPSTEQTRNLASRISTRPYPPVLKQSNFRIPSHTHPHLPSLSPTSKIESISTWPSRETHPPCPSGALVKMASVMAGSKRNFATMAAAADWDDAQRQPVSRKLSPFLSHIVNAYEPSPPTPAGSPSRGMLCSSASRPSSPSTANPC